MVAKVISVHLSNVIQILIIYNYELKWQQTSRGVEATNVPQRGGSASRCNLTLARDSLMGLFMCVCCVTDDSPVTLFTSERAQQCRSPGEVDRPELSFPAERRCGRAVRRDPSCVFLARCRSETSVPGFIPTERYTDWHTFASAAVVFRWIGNGGSGIVQGQEQDGW